MQDWVESAGELIVIDGDFYGFGKLHYPGWEGRTVLVKHHVGMDDIRMYKTGTFLSKPCSGLGLGGGASMPSIFSSVILKIESLFPCQNYAE